MHLEAIAAAAPERYRPEFFSWLKENLHVWDAFARECDLLRARGRTHYSARTVIEVLRHNSAVREAAGEYKISNDNVPDLARLYLQCRPDAQGFFSVKGR